MNRATQSPDCRTPPGDESAWGQLRLAWAWNFRRSRFRIEEGLEGEIEPLQLFFTLLLLNRVPTKLIGMTGLDAKSIDPPDLFRRGIRREPEDPQCFDAIAQGLRLVPFHPVFVE